MGAHTNCSNDAELRNAPDTTAWRRGAGIDLIIVTGIVFGRFDKKPSIRHLCRIVELGKADGEPSRGLAFSDCWWRRNNRGSRVRLWIFATR